MTIKILLEKLRMGYKKAIESQRFINFRELVKAEHGGCRFVHIMVASIQPFFQVKVVPIQVIEVWV